MASLSRIATFTSVAVQERRESREGSTAESTTNATRLRVWKRELFWLIRTTSSDAATLSLTFSITDVSSASDYKRKFIIFILVFFLALLPRLSKSSKCNAISRQPVTSLIAFCRWLKSKLEWLKSKLDWLKWSKLDQDSVPFWNELLLPTNWAWGLIVTFISNILAI